MASNAGVSFHSNPGHPSCSRAWLWLAAIVLFPLAAAADGPPAKDAKETADGPSLLNSLKSRSPDERWKALEQTEGPLPRRTTQWPSPNKTETPARDAASATGPIAEPFPIRRTPPADVSRSAKKLFQNPKAAGVAGVEVKRNPGVRRHRGFPDQPSVGALQPRPPGTAAIRTPVAPGVPKPVELPSRLPSFELDDVSIQKQPPAKKRLTTSMLLRPLNKISPYPDYQPPDYEPPAQPGREPVATWEDQKFEPRHFNNVRFQWKASNLSHNPLYFEDVQLERYGHTYPAIVQPFASIALFSAQFVGLPYQATIDPVCKEIYTLGYYRPGEACIPKLCYRVPWNTKAAAVEAGVVTGLFFLIP